MDASEMTASHNLRLHTQKNAYQTNNQCKCMVHISFVPYNGFNIFDRVKKICKPTEEELLQIQISVKTCDAYFKCLIVSLHYFITKTIIS